MFLLYWFGSTNYKNFGEIRKKLESTLNIITGTTRFPTNLQMHLYSLQISLIIGAIFCIVAAILSSLRGEKYIHEYKVLKPDIEFNIKQQETVTKIKSK